jgi:acyl-CoA thioester hydrolase
VYLKTLGIDFAALAARKINLVVTRVELDYKYPLKSSDSFWIGVRMERLSPVRFGFFQDIFRYPDNKLILKGLITGTALNERGRPFILPEFEKVFPDVVTF